LVVALALAAGCGHSARTPLERTAADLGSIRAATIDLRLDASAVGAPRGEHVGVSVTGPVTLGAGGSLPTARLTIKELGPGAPAATTVTLTGGRAYVSSAGRSRRLTPAETDRLRTPDGDSGVADGFRLADWIKSPRRSRAGAVERTAGTADVPVVLHDLFAMATGFGAPAPVLGTLDDEQNDALQRAAPGSTVTIEADPTSHRLRAVDAVIRLRRSLPSSLAKALARYRGADLHFRFTLRNVGRSPTIRPPST
jgi:hypothetical protein